MGLGSLGLGFRVRVQGQALELELKDWGYRALMLKWSTQCLNFLTLTPQQLSPGSC